MTSRDNIIYYTITAVIFVGIVVCFLLFHNAGQPTNKAEVVLEALRGENSQAEVWGPPP